jgi:hypothetical protein
MVTCVKFSPSIGAKAAENEPRGGAMLVLILFCLLMLSTPTSQAEIPSMPTRWPGYAILGNGAICAVYSDHPGSFEQSTLRGIQHLYYRDFTADYIASTDLEVIDPEEERVVQPVHDPAGGIEVGMENFHTARSRVPLAGGLVLEKRACAHPGGAILLSYRVSGAPPGHLYRFRARLLRRIQTDRTILLGRSDPCPGGMVFSWTNGVSLAIGTHSGTGQAAIDAMGLMLADPLEDRPVMIIIAAGNSPAEAVERLIAIRAQDDPFGASAEHWEAWLDSGRMPDVRDLLLLEAYRRNLYAARACCLNGQIPADITGQFRTHNMPQLYPRDALMCARVFLLAGHLEEARQVLDFWARPEIPRKTPGEWYARYDARGRAVDAGSGARYDEPEWDSNGYLIQLAAEYRRRTGQWPVEPAVLFRLADFLTEHIDDNGLLFEGGIVEWSGYLPATNMIAAAALETASRMAADLSDSTGAGRYAEARERIGSSLEFMFDRSRGTYADVRFAGGKAEDQRSPSGSQGETLFLWDTSANFGILWGYPDHDEMRRTNEFYARSCVRDGGGMQYFDSPDPGLAGYGHDLFFFTTAAAAQYHARDGNVEEARRHIDWMLRNLNVYGLAPERIYLDGSGCSQASPLSWCCAELAAALLEYGRAGQEESSGQE